MAKIPILIIDDSKSHLKLEKLALAEDTYDIRTASNADEAMEVLAEFQPCLILMDIQLPGIDGLELTRRLKANPKYHDIIIVAITAYGMTKDKETALNAGCDGYLSKPIDIETFPHIIANFITHAKENKTKVYR